MKTTIELPDDLVRQVKQIAARDGVTMRELMLAGLRGEVTRRSPERRRPDFCFSTVGGRGLSPRLEPEDVIDLAYDLPGQDTNG